jgi:hypothetical protein
VGCTFDGGLELIEVLPHADDSVPEWMRDTSTWRRDTSTCRLMEMLPRAASLQLACVTASDQVHDESVDFPEDPVTNLITNQHGNRRQNVSYGIICNIVLTMGKLSETGMLFD